jgi:hypothetical protein
VPWWQFVPTFEFTLTFYLLFDIVPASLPGLFFGIPCAHSQVATDRLHSSGQFKQSTIGSINHKYSIFATGWTVMVVGLISAGLGAFVGAYLKRKGEYLATKSLNLTGKIMRFYVKDSAGSKVRWPSG